MPSLIGFLTKPSRRAVQPPQAFLVPCPRYTHPLTISGAVDVLQKISGCCTTSTTPTAQTPVSISLTETQNNCISYISMPSHRSTRKHLQEV